jgi:hypothetical protein
LRVRRAQVYRKNLELKDLAQPVALGWQNESKTSPKPPNWTDDLLKAIGILVSSFAILMGAPFWFDMLNKLVNLRLSGPPGAGALRCRNSLFSGMVLEEL